MTMATATADTGALGTDAIGGTDRPPKMIRRRIIRITLLSLAILAFQLAQYGFEQKWSFADDLTGWKWSLAYATTVHWAQWLKILLLLIDSIVKAAITSITLTYIQVVNNNTINNTLNSVNTEVTSIIQKVTDIRNKIVNNNQPVPGAPFVVDQPTRELLEKLVIEARDARVGADVQRRLDTLIAEVESKAREIKATDAFFEGLEALLVEVRNLRNDVRGGR